MEFSKRKEAVLKGLRNEGGKEDKSLKQEIDLKLRDVCNLINQQEHYYTTSCCSGRVSCYVTVQAPNSEAATAKKRGFIAYCRHELDPGVPLRLDLDQLMHNVRNLKPYYSTSTRASLMSPNPDEPANVNPNQDTSYSNGKGDFCAFQPNMEAMAELKFEPLLLHVKCRTLEHVNLLIRASRAAGLKEIGMFSMSKYQSLGYDFRISGSVRMSVPFQLANQLIIPAEALAALMDYAEVLMKENDARIFRFFAELKKAFAGDVNEALSAS
eukprot:Gregarina_sp_Poly_1__817@NODE_1196_length_4809_cov_126_338465_g821_i0_p3_GENE_NODE_1196_length_4809_cov_126_338465_g821_i0NODE_1196_length_4809_cov_126_338465_g821_i0_p3_ORF_typecomplete_len269_score28_36TYW3/PF02676_14/5_2e38_NODE_1196_length_4809_cov_126_338465_g821_i030853891